MQSQSHGKISLLEEELIQCEKKNQKPHKKPQTKRTQTSRAISDVLGYLVTSSMEDTILDLWETKALTELQVETTQYILENLKRTVIATYV